MDSRISKRAQILKRVLKHINAEDFQDFGDYMVFGMESKLRREEPAPLTQDRDFMGKFDDAIGRYAGHMLSQERTSLMPASDFTVLVNRLDALAKGSGSKFAVKYVQMWRDIFTELPTQETSDVLPDAQIDALDQHYAEKIIDKLESVVSRASRLQRLELKGIPKRSVQIYFEEAHRCYLYGFNLACAVMCRAILESALKARYEPEEETTARKPSKELPPNKRKYSPILKWLDRAQEEKILDGSRVEAGENIKDAGDWAVHRPDEFEANWGGDDELEQLVDDTRKVVEDLHRATPTT
jgi:hypothetical protein